MQAYKFYNVSDKGLLVGEPTNFILPDDVAAIAKARKIADAYDIEILQDKRFVAYVVRPQGVAR